MLMYTFIVRDMQDNKGRAVHAAVTRDIKSTLSASASVRLQRQRHCCDLL